VKSFDQKYGYLLRLYPASYREERGAEMLAVMAENGRPSLRERVALVIGGLRAQLRADEDRTIASGWSVACYLAALTLLLAGMAEELLRSASTSYVWVWAQAAASVVAFGLAWRRRFLPAALLTVTAVVLDAVGRHGIDQLAEWKQPMAILLLIPLIGRARPAVPRWPAMVLLPVVALLQLPLFGPGFAWAVPAVVLVLAVPATLLDHRVGLAVALISVLGVLDKWGLPDMASTLGPAVLAPVVILVLSSLLGRRRAQL
jgi:hypothetical protein